MGSRPRIPAMKKNTIEDQEDSALLRVLEDINNAHDEVTQHRAIERYLRLSIAIAVKNGEFHPAAFSIFSEPAINNKKQ